jgi:hypothetical protein
MTDTERIAVALLGWHFIQTTNTNYRHYSRDGKNAYIYGGGDNKPAGWPDFTTLDGCAEFERALSTIPRYNHYVDILDEITSPPRSTNGWEDAWALILATPSQRVAACIRVLDEVGQ